MISNQNKHKLISVLEHKNYDVAGDTLFIFPDNVNMLSNIIKTSNRFGIKIIPIGFGSTYNQGYSSSENTIFLSSQKLNNIIELDRSNSFLELGAGCNWIEISKNLNSEGLYFPLETGIGTVKRSIGGIFSTLRPDSAVSNYFTGIEFITPDGTSVRYGTKTLKNVSGYDIVKFMAGTFGNFGFVTSLTLRLFRSCKDYFSCENLGDACQDITPSENDPIYLKLKRTLDPNNIFG